MARAARLHSGLELFVLIGLIIACSGGTDLPGESTPETGNVIFIHPDGTGASMWTAMRNVVYGPDGISNWDRLPRMGIYRSHMLNSTNASSHGGATIHAYGTKVLFDTYGNAGETPVHSLSGTDRSIMQEAIAAGLPTALINSGHICEPGTGVFVASAPSRSMTDAISKQVITSGVDIIFSGGEVLLLPEGEMGRHGQPGIRKDGENLIEVAQGLGYTVVYNRDEMNALPSTVEKVLGVFAPYHTFHDKPEEVLEEEGLPLYEAAAPSVAEMAAKALSILSTRDERFIMVVEEEGTDNFGNANNAPGEIEALTRADAVIGEALRFVESHPKTLVITAADSEAGGFQMYPVREPEAFDRPLATHVSNGAPLDGQTGAGSVPFVTAPDRNGTRLHFGIIWSCYGDVAGDVIARAAGLNSEMLQTEVDNTEIYRIMYATLFGRVLEPYAQAD